jgi:hypothetical protein
MTTVAKLLARKQQLLQRLQEGPGSHERDEIERLFWRRSTARWTRSRAPVQARPGAANTQDSGSIQLIAAYLLLA